MRHFVRVCVLGAMAGAALMAAGSSVSAGAFDGVPVEYWTGTGTNEAVMCVDWNQGASATLIFGFRWADGDTATGGDMMNAVNAASSRFYVEISNFGFGDFVDGIGWDVDNDGFSKTDPDDWWQPGWDPGTMRYWGYCTSFDGVTWDYSMVGMNDRTLASGDYDGWANSASGDPPDQTPEPATLLLVGGGCASLAAVRRKGRVKCEG